MKKLYILSSVLLVMLLAVSGGCDGEKQTTLGTQSIETTTTPVEETPRCIEAEYELTGSETYSLVAIYGLVVNATSKEAIVNGTIVSVKYSRAHVEMRAEFYDSSGTLIGTEDRDLVLDGVLDIAYVDFMIKFTNDSQSQIEKCKLIVYALE